MEFAELVDAVLPLVLSVRSLVEIALILALAIAIRKGWITKEGLVSVLRTIQDLRKGTSSALDIPPSVAAAARAGAEAIKVATQANIQQVAPTVEAEINDAAMIAKGEPRERLGKRIGRAVLGIAIDRIGARLGR